MLPAVAGISGLPKTILALVLGLQNGVEDIRVAGGDRHSYPSEVTSRETIVDLVPVGPTIGGLPDPASRSTAVESPRGPLALVGGGVEDPAVGGMEDHVGEAGELIDEEGVGPGAAPIGSLTTGRFVAGRRGRKGNMMSTNISEADIERLLAEADEITRRINADVLKEMEEEHRLQFEIYAQKLEKIKSEVKGGSDKKKAWTAGSSAEGLHEAILDIVKAMQGFAKTLSG